MPAARRHQAAWAPFISALRAMPASSCSDEEAGVMRPPGRRSIVIGAPVLWLVFFFLLPFALVVRVSLSQSVLAQPPFAPTFEWQGLQDFLGKLQQLGLSAYAGLTDDPIYLQAYVQSLAMAAVATLVTLLIAYPLALAMARAPRRLRPILLLLAIAPFWTSYLIRVYAWILLLKDNGLINAALLALGVIREPLHIFATNWAVLIGIVYSYLPFMILPLYASLERQDPSLAEAAADLGATPFAVFRRVTLPLSLPGIIAGVLIVFIPATGEFVIPDLLGGSDTVMIGNTLWNEFFANRDWPTASAVAVVLLILLVGPLILYERMRMQEAPA
jgi:putrescine transport system permease protein